jgi:Obg family GTPase CgtA
MKNETKIILISGNGGDGCVSFRKEKFVSRGGPDGGDGGDGGDIVFIPNENEYDLRNFAYEQVFIANNGEPGGKKNKNGKRGDDLEINLPLNCEIETNYGEKLILNKKVVFLKGGERGRGNVKFKSSINQEPLLAEAGQIGKKKTIIIKSKTFPEAAIIGESNSGKSWLINNLTGSKTKEAEYIFTTKEPFIAQIKNNITDIKIVEMPDFFNIDKARKFLPLLNNINNIFITIKNENFKKTYIEKIIKNLKNNISNSCEISIVVTDNDDYADEYIDDYKVFNNKTYVDIKELLLEKSEITKPVEETQEASYLHKPKIINDNKMYKYFPNKKIIKIIDDEIIRIAKGSNLNKPEVQFQFHNVLNKRNFFQEIKKDKIEKGAIIKLENIELEYK